MRIRAALRFAVVVVFSLLLAALLLVPLPSASAHRLRNGRYLYIASPGVLHVYRFGRWKQVARYSLPQTSDGIRGVDAHPASHSLYIAHGGDGGVHGTGRLLKWNLVRHTVSWDRSYPFGIDQFAVCRGRIFMPTGEQSSGSSWKVLDERSGRVVGALTGGGHPHNTICRHGRVYMGGRGSRYLFVQNLRTGKRLKVGPSPSASPGVRPFTVNATGTRAYITWTNYRGFSVANLRTGAVIASENFGRVPSTFLPSAASHGISLSPGGKRLYVLDAPMQQVEVWTAADKPVHLKNIRVRGLTGMETRCPYDCRRDGWLLHSLRGRYVFVGDSGSVIDTRTRRAVASIRALRMNRHGFLEIDWSRGIPKATSTHFGVGR